MRTKRIVNIIILIGLILLLGRIIFLIYGNKINEREREVNIPAGVVPHHLLAKDIIEDFFSYIASKEEPETIILLSPDHFQAGGSDFITDESVINLDHGITNLIPFVKKYFPDSKIIPFIIPQNVSLEKTEQFVSLLDSQTPSSTLVIASVDFSHYLPPSAAGFHDIKSIRTLINFEKNNFENIEVDSWQALYIARAFAELRNAEFHKIIGHSNSVDFLENKNIEETTSYFSVVFERGFSEKVNGQTILFVGDIMLNRGVEYLMRKNSVFYPFEKISQFLRGVDIVFGNLEGPIVKNPKEFSDGSLKFAFSSDVIEGLLFGNFNLLSLANNHTLNMGQAGLEETREIFKKENINFIGDPIKCDNDFSFEQDDLIFLSFNRTFSFNCSDDEITKIVERARASNSKDFLIVIFHWGNEYEAKSSISQQKLAHKIINAGADVILGSHPHIVQEIEEYKGKLIFYSLGNFIFDQYFSKETQQGLAVGTEIYPEKVIYRLFPIQSHLSQPFLMGQMEAEDFLLKLVQRSDQNLFNQIKTGIIKTER